MGKDAGISEPTAAETDPAYLALQVKSLISTVKNLVDTQQHNAREMINAFSMVDCQQQVNSRIVRDLTRAVTTVRKRCVDGSIDLTLEDFGTLKCTSDGELDLEAYVKEYGDVSTKAGPQATYAACALWAHGLSPDAAVERALERLAQSSVLTAPTEESAYEEQFFGGDHEPLRQNA